VARVVDPGSGQSHQASGDLVSGGTLELTIILPASAIEGVVQDGGAPVPGASVEIVQGDESLGWTQTDDNGEFSLTNLAGGTYAIFAADPNDGSRIAREVATVATGETLSVVVQFAMGFVNIQGYNEVDGVPLAYEYIQVSIEEYGSRWSIGVDLDGEGRVSGPVPAGHVIVEYNNAYSGLYGRVDGVVEAGETLDLYLRVGQHTGYPFDLTGADGFQYWAAPAGDLTFNAGACAPYCGSYASANGEWYTDMTGGLVLLDGREIENGPQTLAGLTVYRRLFVPSAGKFARILDVISNPSDEEIVVDYELEQGAETNGGNWSVPHSVMGELAESYAVLSHDAAGMPAIAIVLGGIGAISPHQGEWQNADPSWFGYVSKWPSLHVAPHSTVILMQFVVQRSHDDADGVIEQAEGLMSLTDPDALTGLTSAERSQIVNFAVQP
jgi:hypothetical protein